MKLLAVVLLLLPLSGCLAKVVDDFTVSCRQFFAKLNGVPSPPMRFRDNNHPDRYKQICQTLRGKPEFATFYDTENKIPVYSAYNFSYERKPKLRTKQKNWFIEPGLDQWDEPNMKSEAAVKKKVQPIKKNIGENTKIEYNQALNADYKKTLNNIKYDRGHLAPVNHANTKSFADATFTLTNAAPQLHTFNGKWYHYAEKLTAKYINITCIQNKLQAYVVTGVVPSKTRKLNKVNIPSIFWTAFCCFDNNNKFKGSGAYIGENIQDFKPEKRHVQDLEDMLKEQYRDQLGDSSQHFTLFGGKCYEETRSEKRPYHVYQDEESLGHEEKRRCRKRNNL